MNEYLGGITRRYIDKFDISLNEFDRITRILDHVRIGSPCGVVYALCKEIPTSKYDVDLLGVLSELWYAACSLTDDIQDGDSNYVGGVLADHITSQSLLLCLAFGLAEKFNLGERMSKTGLSMLTGQTLALTWEKNSSWNIESYKKMSHLFSGEALRFHFSLVDLCVGYEAIDCSLLDNGKLIYIRSYSGFGKILGEMVNILTDEETQDKRWSNINESDRKNYFEKTYKALKSYKGLYGIDNIMGEIEERVRCTPYAKNCGKDT